MPVVLTLIRVSLDGKDRSEFPLPIQDFRPVEIARM